MAILLTGVAVRAEIVTELGVIAEQMPGDHHFDEDYQGVAHRILAHLPANP
jgi:type IV secretory pathway VirJ component